MSTYVCVCAHVWVHVCTCACGVNPGCHLSGNTVYLALETGSLTGLSEVIEPRLTGPELYMANSQGLTHPLPAWLRVWVSRVKLMFVP